jgi:hypothetical protein
MFPAPLYGISKYLFTWIHMPISYLKSERGSASSSLWVSLCGGTMRGTTVKGNDGGRWSFYSVAFWLGWRQNRDMVEWWREWVRLRWSFCSSRGWESGGPGRVADGGGADPVLRFWLKRGGDGTKHCQKMKWRQRSRLGSKGRKRDTV